MITIDGYNLKINRDTEDSHTVVINGAWITLDNKGVRTHDNGPWYDPRHKAVLNAVHALEDALGDLII